MKKVILASVLAMSAIGTASAREVGVTAGHDFAGIGSNMVGLTYSENFGEWSVAAGYDRNLRNGDEADRASLVVTRNMGWNVMGFPVLPKAGGAYVNPEGVRGGHAWLVGVGTRYAFGESLTATLDYRYQVGEDDVRDWDGNQVLLGLNWKF